MTAPGRVSPEPVTAAQLRIVPANEAGWGFTEVSHPSPRRVVMRIDFTD